MFEHLRTLGGREFRDAVTEILENLVPKAGQGIRIHHGSASRPIISATKTRPAPRGEDHPFKGIKVDDTHIKINAGKILGFTGAGPAKSVSVNKDATTVMVSGSGSIWAEIQGSWQRTVTSEVDVTIEDPGDQTITVETSRYVPSNLYEYSTTDPTEGSDWGVGTSFFVEILEFTTTAGVLEITDQLVEGNIEIHESYTLIT